MSEKKNGLPSLRKSPLDFLSREEARQAVKPVAALETARRRRRCAPSRTARRCCWRSTCRTPATAATAVTAATARTAVTARTARTAVTGRTAVTDRTAVTARTGRGEQHADAAAPRRRRHDGRSRTRGERRRHAPVRAGRRAPGALVALAAVLGVAHERAGPGDRPAGRSTACRAAVAARSAATPSRGSGATITCTGVNLGAHSNVYFGIRNDINANGNTMTGASPTGGAVFGFSSSAATSITYTEHDDGEQSRSVSADAGGEQHAGADADGGRDDAGVDRRHPADNGNGDIQRLFQLDSGSQLHVHGGALSTPSFVSVGSDAAWPTRASTTRRTRRRPARRTSPRWTWPSTTRTAATASPTAREQCDLGGGNGAATVVLHRRPAPFRAVGPDLPHRGGRLRRGRDLHRRRARPVRPTASPRAARSCRAVGGGPATCRRTAPASSNDLSGGCQEHGELPRLGRRLRPGGESATA